MPAKTGASHAFAAFLSIIIGSIISNFLSAHTNLLNSVSESAGKLVVGLTGISISEEVTGLLAISSLLAFFWGIAYHYARHGSGKQTEKPKSYQGDKRDTETTRQMFSSVEAEEGSHSPDQEVDPTYRTRRAVWTADETLRSKLEEDLSDVKSRLDDIHDRLYDIEESEKAKRVMEVADSVHTLERTITRIGERIPHNEEDNTDETDALDSETRRKLLVTHYRLVDVVNELVEAIDELYRGGADIHAEAVEECEILLRECERTVSKRQDIIKHLGEKQ
jgi:hypothetical protein